jgi:hypothetical protein
VLQQRLILWFGGESTDYHLKAFSNRRESMTADALMSQALLKSSIIEVKHY